MQLRCKYVYLLVYWSVQYFSCLQSSLWVSAWHWSLRTAESNHTGGCWGSQKHVVKAVIEENLFLYEIWMWQPVPFKIFFKYMYVYACTYAFGESDGMHFPKRKCTSYFTKCGWEAVFINSNFFSLVMYLHRKDKRNASSQLRFQFLWLSIPLFLVSAMVPEWNPTSASGETPQVQQVWDYGLACI